MQRPSELWAVADLTERPRRCRWDGEMILGLCVYDTGLPVMGVDV